MPDYTLTAKITGDASSFEKTVKRAEALTANLNAKIDKIASNMVSAGSKLTVGLTAPIALAAKKMVSSASDYQENLNKIDVAFGKSGKVIKEWSKTATKEFGLSRNEALESTALFGDMATSMGFTQKKAADMAKTLAGLAGDMASFKNVDVKQAMTALNGVFTGETESLKQLGIIMTQTNLEEFAAKTGKVYKNMSQAEKVQLRYNYVLAMGKNSMGDYSETADGTANTLKTFSKSVDNLCISLGENLLPIITPIVQNMTELVDKFNSASPAVQQMSMITAGIGAAAGPALVVLGKLTQVSQGLSAGFTNVGMSVSEIPNKMKSLSLGVQGVINDFKGLGKAIIQPFEGLGSAIAKPFKVMGKMVSDTFTNFGKIAKTHLTNFGNIIAQKMQPITNAFHNFNLVISNHLETLGKIISDKIAPITNAFSRMGTLIHTKLTNIGTFIGNKTKAISNAFHNFGTALSSKFINLGKVIDNKFGNVFSKTASKISAISARLSSSLKQKFAIIGESLGPLKEKLISMAGSFGSSMSKIFGALSPILSKIGSSSAVFMKVFMKGFNIAAIVGIALAGLGLLQQGFGDKLGVMLKEFQTKGPEMIQGFVNGIVQKIPVLISAGGTLITQFGNAIIANLPSIIQGGIKIVSALVSGLAWQLPTLMPMAVQLVMTIVSSLVGNIDMLINAGIDLLTGFTLGIVNAIPQLTSQLPQIIKSIVSTIISNLPKIIKTGIRLLITLGNGIVNAIPDLVLMLPDVMFAIIDAFSSQDWGQLGRDIISGLINGLKSMLSNLWSAVKDVASGVAEKFAEKLKIHSPSRLFMQYGKYTDEGYAIGIAKGKKAIYKELDALNIPQTFVNTKLPSTSSISSTNTAPVSQARTDMSGLGDYIVAISTDQFSQMANALERGISGMRMTADGREVGRFVSNLGFAKARA